MGLAINLYLMLQGSSLRVQVGEKVQDSHKKVNKSWRRYMVREGLQENKRKGEEKNRRKSKDSDPSCPFLKTSTSSTVPTLDEDSGRVI